MTVDRDRPDDAGPRLPTVVFRPWPPRPAPLPAPSRSSIRPRFVRSASPAGSGQAHAAAPAMVDARFRATTDHQQRTSWVARPPRFARFVAALQSAGGALGPEPALWAAEPWDGARPNAAARAPTGSAEDGSRPGLGRLASLAAIGRVLPRPANRRSALLIGAASLAVLALVALFAPTGGQDRARLTDPPAEVGGLVRAPPTPDRYRPAAGDLAPSVPNPLPVAHQPPASPVATGHPVAQKAEALADLATPGRAALEVDASVPEKAEPPGPRVKPGDPAPAPASLARLSAAVRPAPPRIEATAAGLAADGKFQAVAVRTGALAGPEAPDDDPLYELAHRLQEKGQIARAIEAYRLAARANPRHAATYYDWGYLLQKQGDENGARQKYLLTLRLAPRHAFAHYNLGYILQKHGDYADAIKHYRAAIAANPSFFWSYYNLGYIEQKEGRYREALVEYRKSIEVDPKQALSYENIATILRYHRTH
jgi:tetratricopeptide (TPR) repeat protein